MTKTKIGLPPPIFKMNMEMANTNPVPVKQPDLYPLPYVPYTNPYMPSLMPPMMNYNLPLGLTPMTPIVKRYNITNNDFHGDNVHMANIYEDILPPVEIFQNRFTTIKERLVIYKYIRSILTRREDGELIVVAGDYNNNKRLEVEDLIKHIRVMDINPYHISSITNNVYRTIKHGMVSFRSCYPVRYNTNNFQVECARDSVGIHIRIYRLQNLQTSEVWDDIKFYEKIRENVLTKNICPNFALLYSYYKTSNSTIDFDKLDALSVDKNSNIYSIHTSDLTKILGPSLISNEPTETLIALVEGSTANIISWASKVYFQNYSPIIKQAETGYHSIKIWHSIIFQLLAAMYVLEQQGIMFLDFNLETNVYIKDLKLENNKNITYWKYIIDGIEYYVPNYGFLVLIDSSFHQSSTSSPPARIIFKENNQSEFDTRKKNNLNKIIQLDGILITSTPSSVTTQPTELNNLMIQIESLSEFGIKYIIREIFTPLFLHNRVGSVLQLYELVLLNPHNKNFRNGEIVAFSITSQYYLVAIYYKDTNDYIITKKDENNIHDKNLSSREITLDQIYKLSGIIDPEYQEGHLLSSDKILATYTIY
jgi:hypothetical protein